MSLTALGHCHLSPQSLEAYVIARCKYTEHLYYVNHCNLKQSHSSLKVYKAFQVQISIN